MRVAVFLILAVFPRYSVAQDHPAECGMEEKKSSIYQAFESCKKQQGGKLLSSMKDSKNPFCPLRPESGKLKQEHLALCRDPNGTLCAENKAYAFGLDCKLWLQSPKEVMNMPSVVDFKCRYQSERAALLKQHRDECDPILPDCDSYLRLTYKDELMKLERKLVYTPERMDRVNRIFNEVKSAYLQKLRNSKVVPDASKDALIAKIAKTTLADPFSSPVECMNSLPIGLATEIYNDTSKNRIIFCLGAFASLDDVNDFDLIHTIGHELSHSIAPCSLEQDALEDTGKAWKGDPGIALRTYGPTLRCLRGGTGADGCKGSVLHCNTPVGERAELFESIDEARKNGQTGQERYFQSEIENTPSCPHGKSNPAGAYLDLSEYRRDPTPIDQIDESFSDLWGAGVLGDVVKARREQGMPLTESDEVNALQSISSTYSRIHGGCRRENTNDVHPPGFLRLNRVIFSSPDFRDALGCKAPPVTKNAGISCSI